MSLSVGKIMNFPQKDRSRADAMVEALHNQLEPGLYEWVQAIRRRGYGVIGESGLPTPKLESWKYTNLSKALKMELTQGHASIAHDGLPAKTLQECLNDPPVWLRGLLADSADGSDAGLTALRHLNDVFLRDGLVIDLPKGMATGTLTVTGQDGAFTAPRILIRLGEGAQLTLLETQDGFGEGAGAYWKSGVTQIVLGAGAVLRHIRELDDSAEAENTHATQIWLERDATYNAFTMTTGGRLTRNQIHAVLEGQGAHVELNTVQLQRGQQQADTTMLVEHRAPRCTSNQFTRTVLDDQAHGVCQGKVYVTRDAQKTDGYQLSNTLLLSEGAEMDTKPELEIYADDVKCSHGATTGRLDEVPLFYMRSRGIPEAEARTLLIEAFLQAIIDKAPDAAAIPMLTERATSWLAR